MQILMIFLFRPSLGDGVEPFQGQFRHPFEHGHQAPFHRGPEGLLLGILIRAVRQRGLVQYAELV